MRGPLRREAPSVRLSYFFFAGAFLAGAFLAGAAFFAAAFFAGAFFAVAMLILSIKVSIDVPGMGEGHVDPHFSIAPCGANGNACVLH